VRITMCKSHKVLVVFGLSICKTFQLSNSPNMIDGLSRSEDDIISNGHNLYNDSQFLPVEHRTGTISLNSDTLSLFSNAIYIVPVLLFIVILDFAIFGTFANRSDELNPVSNFFYHARRGMSIMMSKYTGGPTNKYVRRRPNPHRHNRSLEMFGPVLDALVAAKEKYA